MTNEERMYLLDECIKQYREAEKLFLINPGEFLETLGKAKMLKEIIEKLIGEKIQLTKYYKKYIKIVQLNSKF